MKAYGKISLALICGILGFIGLRSFGLLSLWEVISERKQSRLHDQIFSNVLNPTAVWTREFQIKEGRLPSQAQIDEFIAKNGTSVPILIYTNAFAGERPWARPGVDFVLCAPVSDWNLYHQSWDRKNFKYWTD